ncbi:MAG TPA: hypothetical protein VIK72_12150 [Clostridiaceae bacterium]
MDIVSGLTIDKRILPLFFNPLYSMQASHSANLSLNWLVVHSIIALILDARL